MKWILVVVVFGLGPVQTNLVYDDLESCLRAEEVVRGQWLKHMNAVAAPGTLAELNERDPNGANFLAKQITPGTCIPHAATKKNSN